jgi:NAD(P)-dependent dehydrogenase (short-subunit alcohol dehydrogenase family)
MLLDGKVAVVTGAGSGIGRASALRFAAERAAVVVADRRQKAAQATTEAIVGTGGRAVACMTDVSDAAAVGQMVALAVEHFGGLDVLFSNAAATVPGSAVDLPVDGWDLMWRTNVSSLYLGAKHAIPAMVQRGGGAIVATASISGLTADAGQIGYATTKAAVMGLVRALAVDHARDGIRVNCICPGMTATPPLLHALGSGPLKDAALDSSPIGRLAEPEEIAAVALWLASEESSFVNGQAIVADGGLGVESQFSRLVRMPREGAATGRPEGP